MAKKSRLSDTAAIVASPMEGNVEHTRSTRKIDNGYLVRESSYNSGTGEYKCSERFSEGEPRLGAPAAKDKAGSNGLGDTMGYLNNDK